MVDIAINTVSRFLVDGVRTQVVVAPDKGKRDGFWEIKTTS